MTNYNFRPPQAPLSSSVWNEKREKRKKQLEEVRRRRAVMYELMRKMQQAR